jgi:putative transposase
MLADARVDLTFASFPTPHWIKIWSTNPLERVNKVKRGTNVGRHLPPTTLGTAGWPARS